MAHCISSHMGQWSTDRKSGAVLPKPIDEYQMFVHLADYLASRKDLTMNFEGWEQQAVQVINPNDYVINFGKHKGEKLIDVFRTDHDYCMWLKENSYQREIVDMIKKIEATQEDEI